MPEASNTFRCVEPECRGLVPRSDANSFMRQVVGNHPKQKVYWCPNCARIYWEDGQPVHNNELKKVYYCRTGQHNTKELPAEERAKLVLYYMALTSKVNVADRQIIMTVLATVASTKHTRDCNIEECSCGRKAASCFILTQPH